MSIQVKQQAKTDVSVTVTFEQPFSNIPIVIVTPFWNASTQAVGHISTVTSITKTECIITSGNAASENFYVNILAFDPEASSPVENMKVIGGKVQKQTIGEIEVDYPSNRYLDSPDPATLLSPFWDGNLQGVSYVETLDDNAASEIKIISNNAAGSGYYVNYFAMDLGVGSDNSGNLYEAGVANKIGPGKLRVYFEQKFTSPPHVNVSPWYNDQNSEVGDVETIVKITNTYFEVISANQSPDYFVTWIAIQIS